jgi:drug/metabolite transporter (DMT)-like permease
MPPSALLLALAAAFLHAFWNLLLAGARDTESATAVALVVSVVVFAPVAAAGWDVDSRVWPFVVATGLFELAYFALLARAYRRAELSVVYPVARGLAPVLVLAAGAAVLGASTSGLQALGVLVVAAGVVLVRGLRVPQGEALALGLAIAACIASYTLIDKHGIAYAPPIVYLELSMAPVAFAYAGAVVAVRGWPAVRAQVGARAVAAGLATFAAYALVLAALARASAASVAAVRETSVVVATALAALVLRERVGPGRLAGAVLVAAGVALLAR